MRLHTHDHVISKLDPIVSYIKRTETNEKSRRSHYFKSRLGKL